MRKTLFTLHSYAALIALIPLVMVSLTGSLLVFKTEIDQWLMPEKAALAYDEVLPQRENLNALKANIESRHPDYVIGSWEMFSDGREADRVYLIKKGTADWYKLYFDPFANSILSEPVSLHSDLTDWLLHLHYTFLLNDLGNSHSQLGTLIGVFVALILTFLGVSGLILHRKFWKNLFTLRWQRNTRILTGDLHRFIGLWSSPVILALGVTGLYFNVVEYYHETFEHADEATYFIRERLYHEDIDFQHLLDDSQTQLETFTPTYLLMPYEPDLQITFYGYQPDANPFASHYASTATYDKQSGELLAAFDGTQAAAVTQVLDSFRELHFGSFGGLASKILWCILGLSPLWLGASGVYLWYYRRAGGRKKKIEQASLA